MKTKHLIKYPKTGLIVWAWIDDETGEIEIIEESE